MEILVKKHNTRMCWEYDATANYENYVIKVISSEEDLKYVLGKSKKCLMFVGNKERGKKLMERQNKVKANSAEFIDSMALKKLEVAKQLIQIAKFEVRFLFVTNVLDVGVSIVDPEVDTIILDPTTRTEFIQMLARVRTKHDQKITVYVQKADLIFFLNRIAAKEEFSQMALMLLKNRQSDLEKIAAKIELGNFGEFQPRMMRNFLYQNSEKKWILNELTCMQTIINMRFCKEMAQKISEDENAFVKEQFSWLGKEFTEEAYVQKERLEMQKKN